ncbi:hypothetical protein FBY31_4615 [Arthrobacter sp. SLBN-100]|nr:hypothetical protein FBY31_4615 [Arthrobacter sp. SLBN-100]
MKGSCDVPTTLQVAAAEELKAVANATGEDRGGLIGRAVHNYLQTMTLTQSLVERFGNAYRRGPLKTEGPH